MRLRAPSTPPPLLLLMSLLLAARSAPRSAAHPTTAYVDDDPARAKQLELIEHVLRDDRRWSRVLRRGVKLTAGNRPPYHDDDDDDPVAADPEVRALLRLVEPGAAYAEPLSVVQRAARFRWLGSHVEYAAYVTRTAFACVAHGVARLAVRLALLMWDAAAERAAVAGRPAPRTAAECAEHGMPERTLSDLAALLATLAAHVAAVHGDVTAAADALFVHADAEVYVAGGGGGGAAEPAAQYRALSTAHRRFDEHVDARCAPAAEADAFLDVGLDEFRDGLDGGVDSERLAETFDRVVAAAAAAFDALDVGAVSPAGWASVVDYGNPAVKCAAPYQQPYHGADPFEVLTDTRLREVEKLERRRGRGVSAAASRDGDAAGRV